MTTESPTGNAFPWPSDPAPVVLADAMEKEGWSQVDIAVTLGWDQGKVSRVLSGERSLSWRERWQIAIALEVEPEQLGVTAGSA
jgi:transcriptional regulator with XRE-family HTH domain